MDIQFLMSVVIVEKVYKFEDRLLREERESHYVREFDSRVKGLNIDSWIALQIKKILSTPSTFGACFQ